jgi:hypothetical protein
MSYSVLVLPRTQAMTPRLLRKLSSLADAGAMIIGAPPETSLGLEGYPVADASVRELAAGMWKKKNVITDSGSGGIYQDYPETARLLLERGIKPDFESTADLRHIHRHGKDAEIFFVANRTNETVSADCAFRVQGRRPELFDPVDGSTRPLPEFTENDGVTTVPLAFAPAQGFFVIFRNGVEANGRNFPETRTLTEIAGPWNVSFDPRAGGPAGPVVFESLVDWTKRPEASIRFYSGIAVYQKSPEVSVDAAARGNAIEIGPLHGMARVELNGTDLGVVWCAPWRVAVPKGLLKTTGNTLRIRVANLWPNRLIGDAGLPEAERITKTTWNPYKPTDTLLPSGLAGPVKIIGRSE